MTQTIEYVVKVNATQAQAAVADVEKRFGGVDSVVARVDKSIIALERDMKDLNAAIAAGGPNVEHYRKEMQRLSGAVGGTSGGSAVSGGGRGLGMAALETSRAVEDLQYGLAGVVNNIPGLVMALGGGAGLTAAISLAAVGVNQLYKNFLAVPDATETATTTAKSYIKDLRDEIAELGKDLRTVQIGATGVAMEEQRKRIQIAMVEARSVIDAVGGQEALADLRQLTKDRPEMLPSRGWGPLASRNYVSPEAFQAAIDAQTKLDLEIKKMQQLQLIELEKEDKKAAEERGRSSAKAFIKGTRSGRKEVEDFSVESGDDGAATAREEREQLRREAFNERVIDMQMKADEKQEREAELHRKELERAEQLHLSRLEQLEGDSLAARMAFDTVAMNHKMENLDKLKAHEFKNLKDNVKQYEGMYNDIGQLAQGSMSTLINVSQDYFKAKIEGAEHAEEMAAAAFLSGVGEQLVGLGTKNIFEGASLLAMSFGVDPRGYAMLGIGTAAIAAGVGMGAGSAAISHQAAGGTVGKPLEDKKAAKDRGASPRSGSGGGGGSGGLTVNVSYGAGGPLPEDIAREIDKVVKQNDRRRGAA
jgi:hypothetical protein